MTITCPQCGAPLAPDAPADLCPGCLLREGLVTADARSPGRGDSGFVPPTTEELTQLFPELEIQGLIGRGGMGAVYRASQPGLGRTVALKVLPRESGADPSFAERFVREARALARLNHANIVTIFDFGQVDDLYFFVMELVEGTDLRRLMDAGLAPSEALALIGQICDALQYAHDQGVVHRDIKPENVLVDRNGHVKIADFGLAKLLDQDAPNFALTSARDVLGTLHYMAPEQLERPTEVDHRADIYSLGVVFYEMLTGELPIGRFDPPSQRIQVDVRLDEVVLRALAKEPSRRYQSATDLKSRVQLVSETPASVHGAETRILGHGHPRERTRGPAAFGPPRFCWLPVMGIAWHPLALVLCVPLLVARAPVEIAVQGGGAAVETSGGPGLLGTVLTGLCMAAVFATPLITTVLGWVGVARIRASAGRLYGLGLAVLVGLVYPLIALDVVITQAMQLAFGPNAEHDTVAGIAILLCLLVDAIVAIMVWRAVRGPTPRPHTA